MRDRLERIQARVVCRAQHRPGMRIAEERDAHTPRRKGTEQAQRSQRPGAQALMLKDEASGMDRREAVRGVRPVSRGQPHDVGGLNRALDHRQGCNPGDGRQKSRVF